MNILYLINHAGKGGSEKYVKSMAEYAAAKGANIFFVYNEKGPLVAVMEKISKKTMQLTMRSPFDCSAARSLSKFCANNKIDIVHTQFARENYIAILSNLFARKPSACKTAIIHTCHINTPNNNLWRLMNKVFMKANYRVIAVCTSARDLLIKNNYPADKIQLVFNGIEYREDLEKPDKADKPFVFVSLTRFSEEKGIFFLLESAKVLFEKGVDFTLTIAGDGPLYEEAKRYTELNKLSEVISLPGYCDNAGELLLKADCFINSSSSEALSFAILEAMEAGLPVIATDVGGNPDIVNEKTNCGILVAYNNSNEMAEAMNYMLDNPLKAHEMAENARKAVKEIFNVDNCIKTTYNVYSEAVESRVKGGTK